MRSRVPLFVLLFAVGSFALPVVAHAGIPFFGPIVPEAVNRCAAGWGAVIDVINRIIEFLITIAIVFVAPLMIAWSGFLFVVNPVNASGKEQAKKILWNTVIGIVIALCGWLIVDAIMAALYNANAPVGTTGGVLGTWSDIIGSRGKPFCQIQEGALKKLDQTNLSVTGVNASGSAAYVSGKAGALCSDANAACSVASLKAAGFNQTQATVMSCIAGTENRGNAVGCNGNACGTFQIMLTVNPLVGSACAKYNNGNSTLNCPSLCKAANGGAVKNETSCQPCVQAANDAQCNAQAARNLVASSGGYGPWTTSSDNKQAPACVQQYGNG